MIKRVVNTRESTRAYNLPSPTSNKLSPLRPRVLSSWCEPTMSFFSTASTAGSSVASATDKDIEVADPPTDSISSLAWSPQADFLAAGSWDNNVRLCLRATD